MKPKRNKHLKATTNLAITALNGAIVTESDKWIVEKIQIVDQIYSGPQAGFAYMTFGEFVYADSFFLMFELSLNEKELDELLAVLYRHQANQTGDLREDFDTKTVDLRKELWGLVPYQLKLTILTNYKLVRSQLAKRYPFVFGTSGQTSVKGKATQGNWISVRDSIVGDSYDFDRIDSLFLSDVLRKLNTNIQQNEQ